MSPAAADLHDPQQILERATAPAGSPLPLPRLLVVLAHPDDEVLALGARLERLAASRLLTVTDGAPTGGDDARHHGFATLDDYRAARRAELSAALTHAGLSPEIAQPLTPQVPDQAASLHLAALTRAIVAEVAAFHPEAVLTHPYEGGHPDHDATAFAVHTALRLLEADGHPVPVLLEAPFYNAGPNGSMRTGTFLDPQPAPLVPLDITATYPTLLWSSFAPLGASLASLTSEAALDQATTVPTPIVQHLSPSEQANKQARLACFASQAETLAQFATDRELFRLAPAYDFTQSPHPGKLLYEHFPWGMSGDRFRSLAAEATAELFGTTETTQAA